MRLKRLARLGGPSTSSAPQPPPEDHNPSRPQDHHEAPRQSGPSANSRLLSGSLTPSTPRDPPLSPRPASSSAKPTYTAPKAGISSPAPLGKRPNNSTPISTASPVPGRSAAAQTRLTIPYALWESDKIDDIFGVTLDVRFATQASLTSPAHKSRTERLETMLAQGTATGDHVREPRCVTPSVLPLTLSLTRSFERSAIRSAIDRQTQSRPHLHGSIVRHYLVRC